jgi:hypothetical protein
MARQNRHARRKFVGRYAIFCRRRTSQQLIAAAPAFAAAVSTEAERAISVHLPALAAGVAVEIL